MHRGWICAPSRDERARLEALGVRVGEWDEAEQAFLGCEVDDLAALDGLWGEFVWGLEDASAKEA